jgi:hypothetical protein
VETFTEPGVPDSFYCFGGVSGWIEFKRTGTNRIKSLDDRQVLWHARLARKGGRSFFAVRRNRDLLLVPGCRGADLLGEGLSAVNPLSWRSPWPWEAIEIALLARP